METSEQVRGYLLCRVCEDLFNKGGEAWVLKNCWRTYSKFPLRDTLRAATPLESDPRWTTWAGASVPGVDVDKLAYFAASVFWRSSLQGWRSVAGHVGKRLLLGPYADELRLFLLHQRAFPTDVVLVTFVSASTEAAQHRGVILPHFKRRDPKTRLYRFSVLGITFDMFIGKGIPSSLRTLCTVRSPNRLLHSSANVDDTNFADTVYLQAQGRPVGRLRR